MSTHERRPRAPRGEVALALCLPLLWPLWNGRIGPPTAPSSQAAGAAPGAQQPAEAPSLDETRLVMGKWIETQQIISRERNEWQQGKEILVGRLDLVKRELASLEEKIQQSQTAVAEIDGKKTALVAELDALKATGAGLATSVTQMEGGVRRLLLALPEPLETRLLPLRQRIPDDPETTRVSVAERFQNVLGVLNEINKANNELTVSYEVRNLADGKPSEVRVLYVGLAQAYYLSAGGEAGIGRPTAEGWEWENTPAVADDVRTALEIIQGKHTPAFVPLPMKLQ